MSALRLEWRQVAVFNSISLHVALRPLEFRKFSAIQTWYSDYFPVCYEVLKDSHGHSFFVILSRKNYGTKNGNSSFANKPHTVFYVPTLQKQPNAEQSPLNLATNMKESEPSWHGEKKGQPLPSCMSASIVRQILLAQSPQSGRVSILPDILFSLSRVFIYCERDCK